MCRQLKEMNQSPMSSRASMTRATISFISFHASSELGCSLLPSSSSVSAATSSMAPSNSSQRLVLSSYNARINVNNHLVLSFIAFDFKMNGFVL